MALETLADIERFETVPLKQRHLPVSTYDILRSGAIQFGSRIALSFFADAATHKTLARWTYTELLRDVTRTANAFHALGIRSGDVVAYILPNLPETHLTIWGGEAAGIAFAINPQLGAQQMRDLLVAADARIVVTLAPTPGVDLWPRVRDAIERIPGIRDVVWATMAPYLGRAQRAALALLALRERVSLRGRHYSVSDFRHCIARQPGDRLVSGRQIDAADIASYFCTGGTTGLPKIAIRSHRCEVFDSWAVGVCINDPADTPPVILCGLPLFHVNAQLVTGLQVWINGGTVLLATPQGFRGKNLVPRLWEIVAHHRVASFSGVPTLYASLLQVEVGDHDISSLRYVACGAAPMPAEVLLRFERKVGVPIVEGYGLTEAGCVSAINLPGGRREAGTIGFRLPYQAMAVAILDEADAFSRWAEPNQPGRLIVRGPNLFEGYLGGSGKDGPWIDVLGERWLDTGDLGVQSEDGLFRIVGRSKDLIIRGGHNIDPRSIEDAIALHPDVAFVAAVGRPDRHAGEVPVAYVELVASAATTLEELERFAAERIGERASIPKAIAKLDTLPKTAIGKIHKPTLIALEIEKVVRAELRGIGVEPLAVGVEQDKLHGFVARIVLAEADQGGCLATRLGGYTFKTTLDVQSTRRGLPQ